MDSIRKIKTDCVDCGKPAIKHEDFLVEDCLNGKYEYPGIVRISMCADCIKKRHVELLNSQISVVKIILQTVIGAIIILVITFIGWNLFPNLQWGLFVLASFVLGCLSIYKKIRNLWKQRGYKKRIQDRFSQNVANNFMNISLGSIIMLPMNYERTILNIGNIIRNPELFSNTKTMTVSDILEKSDIVCAPLVQQKSLWQRRYFEVTMRNLEVDVNKLKKPLKNWNIETNKEKWIENIIYIYRKIVKEV